MTPVLTTEAFAALGAPNLVYVRPVKAAEIIAKMKPLPDGVFVANDNCAVSCLLSLKQRGIRIPEDIAIVGFNNDLIATVVEPNLSTINYPGYEMGEVAARHLIDHLNGVSNITTTNTIILRSELLVRASSLKRKPEDNG